MSASNDTTEGRRWINLGDVARLLNKDRKTARRVVEAGGVRSRLLPGCVRRDFDLEDVKRLADGRHPGEDNT